MLFGYILLFYMIRYSYNFVKIPNHCYCTHYVVFYLACDMGPIQGVIMIIMSPYWQTGQDIGLRQLTMDLKPLWIKASEVRR